MRSLIRATLALTLLSLLLPACGDDFARVSEGEIADIPDITFEPTLLGRTSQRQFQIRNNGDGDLVISNIEIVDASPFIQFSSGFLTSMAIQYDWRQGAGGQTWDEHPAFVLEAKREIQVDIIFNPTSTDLQCPSGDPAISCGRIVITSDDRRNPVLEVNIALSQSSGRISVDPTVITFPDIVGGPYEDSFVITNTGDGPLSGITVTDPSVDGITLQETSNRQEPFTLDIGEESEYEVTFTPVPGVDYCPGRIGDERCVLGEIIVDSNDVEGARTTVTVEAGGIRSPDIDVSTNELVFTQASVGNPETLTVDVSNVGGANLTWNLSIIPIDARPLFALEVAGTAVPSSGQQMASPILPSNTETVEITLAPQDEEPVSAQLVIRTNDPDESETIVRLFGGAPAAELEVEPTQLLFYEITPGTTADLQFVISNPGRATLNISSGEVDSDEFSISPPLAGQTVPAGGRMAVTVTYNRPEGDLGGLDHGVLTILSDALSPNDDFDFNLFAYHDADALPPTAVIDASPAEPYSVGQTVTLDASSSEPPATGSLPANPYRWVLLSQPAGSSADLSSNFEEIVTLVPDVAGTYTVLLTVTATISETVSTQNQVTRNLLVQ